LRGIQQGIHTDRRPCADRPQRQIETADTAPRTDLLCVNAASPARAPLRTHPRPQAAFLAHLIAMAQRAPQTLDKRRADPREAIDRYAAAAKAAPGRPGHVLKRAV
jgi:hypothetical protein